MNAAHSVTRPKKRTIYIYMQTWCESYDQFLLCDRRNSICTTGVIWPNFLPDQRKHKYVRLESYNHSCPNGNQINERLHVSFESYDQSYLSEDLQACRSMWTIRHKYHSSHIVLAFASRSVSNSIRVNFDTSISFVLAFALAFVLALFLSLRQCEYAKQKDEDHN